MKSRQEIKALAREAFAEQRATAIIIVLLLMLFGGVLGLLGIIPFIGVIFSLVGSAVALVLAVNLAGAFIRIYKREKVEVGEPFSNLRFNFMRKLGGMLWFMLWVAIWSLLFVIPGIVKGLSYYMTYYILADCPNVKATDAIKLSARMMHGHKMELFVLYLSFIGWLLLSAMTFGILFVVYVGPYIESSLAGFYVSVREKALVNGVISAEELA
jgi:uncharacterized membrane protein